MSLVFATTFFWVFFVVFFNGGGGGVLRHSAVQTVFEFEISGPLLTYNGNQQLDLAEFQTHPSSHLCYHYLQV